MTRWLAAVLACCAAVPAAWAQVQYKIATAQERGTYHAIGRDLAKYVAPEAGIELEVLATPGSAANVRMLRREPGVKLGIIQADVFQAFVDHGKTSREAASLIQPLRVITPLYDTEVHFIVRADSPMNALHDLRNARINGGPIGSGAALIAHTAYRMMFGAPLPEAQASYYANEEALVRLVTDHSVDVVVIAAGQPAPIVANMKPEAQQLVKLLKLDPKHAASQDLLGTYSAATVRASSYPNLLREDFTTLAVGAYLVTFDHPRTETVNYIARFARALCENLPTLREKGHPKWREVELSLPVLPPGWSYYRPTTLEINACMNAAQARQRPAPPAAKGGGCSAEARILGLCS